MNDARQSVMDVLFGRWRSQILYAGVRLGIFDALAAGPRKADHLAAELRLDGSGGYRLLRALACLGLVREDGDRSFSLTPAGEFLRADHPQTLRGMALLEEGPEHYAIWKHLCAIVREGGPDGFVREFGHPVFAHTVQDSGYGAVFNEAMSSFSGGETAMVLEALAAYDFSRISHVCDVGGGHGHLLCSVLAKYPHLRGTLYDMPSVIERKDLLWADKMGVSSRCQHVPGDMFREVPGADAYLLKHILQNWKDTGCVQVLSNMSKAAVRDSRAFIAEYVVPGPETAHFAKLFDIHMMCATGGQERTKEEYTDLLGSAGWRYVRTWYPASKLMGVVEAIRA
jgi:O-methyltransferase domain/Dimerisation domain